MCSATSPRASSRPQGTIRLTNSTLIEDSGQPDPVCPNAREVPVGELPPETLRYLMGSRFCEVDLLSPIAVELFGDAPRGWGRVQAICDWVNSKVTFSYAAGAPHAHGARRLHRAGRRLPRLPAPGDHLLPRPEHPGALHRRLSRRHRRAAAALADGFQRLVRGLPGRPLVDVRRPPQPGRASAASCSPPASTPPTSPSPRHSAASKLTHFEVVTDEIV